MTFRLPDCILTWIFTPRRLFGLVDLSYVFSGSCLSFLSQRDGHCGCLTLVTPCVETGSQKTNLMLLCITLWNSSIALTHCLSLQETCFTPPSEVIAKDKQIRLISLPYSLRRTRKWHGKLSSPTPHSRPISAHIHTLDQSILCIFRSARIWPYSI